jgi:hypothetical protein
VRRIAIGQCQTRTYRRPDSAAEAIAASLFLSRLRPSADPTATDDHDAPSMEVSTNLEPHYVYRDLTSDPYPRHYARHHQRDDARFPSPTVEEFTHHVSLVCVASRESGRRRAGSEG